MSFHARGVVPGREQGEGEAAFGVSGHAVAGGSPGIYQDHNGLCDATAGRIELKSLITKTYRYDEINEALADLEHGKLRMGISLWN